MYSLPSLTSKISATVPDPESAGSSKQESKVSILAEQVCKLAFAEEVSPSALHHLEAVPSFVAETSSSSSSDVVGATGGQRWLGASAIGLIRQGNHYDPVYFKDGGSSEDEGSNDDELYFFAERVLPPKASRMTVFCQKANIKGSTLIQITHDIVRSWYDDAIELAKEAEKDDETCIVTPPEEKDGALFVKRPVDWFLSLGGWKKSSSLPKEVKNYFIYPDVPDPARQKTFSRVKIYDPTEFTVSDDRLHVPPLFSVDGVDVTNAWDFVQKKYIKKTDLSYNQIAKAITDIRVKADIPNDQSVAVLQLYALSRSGKLPEWFNADYERCRQFLCFLDFLNGLMFGIEASGLNAALATGLMLLDLIAQGVIDYQKAFCYKPPGQYKSQGGFYPYACYTGEAGRYQNREDLIQDTTRHEGQPSMVKFRSERSLSTVAAREAILIKQWLQSNNILNPSLSFEEQTKEIEKAIEGLIHRYYPPASASGLCPDSSAERPGGSSEGGSEG